MARTFLFLIFLTVTNVSKVANAEALPTLSAEITVYSNTFYRFVARDSSIEVLSDHHIWAEGPVWSRQLNALLFSDVGADTIYRWNEENGATLFLKPSGHAPDQQGSAWRGSNGLAIDNEGRLILAQQSSRVLSRLVGSLDSPAPNFQAIAQNYQQKRLNSPNDVIVHPSGKIFFTDPPYGLSGFENSELGFFGVFQLEKNGDLVPIIKTIEMPNGIALTKDGSTLFVSSSAEHNPQIFRINLDQYGGILNSELFFDSSELKSDGPGSTDGLAVHSTGYVFTSVPNGIAIISPEGKLLGKIALGQVTNMTFDGNQSSLFITTPNQLLRLKMVDKN